MVLLLVTGAGILFRRTPVHDSGPTMARQAYQRAIERGLAFDPPGLVRELLAAWHADPSYLPALELPASMEFPMVPLGALSIFDSLAAAHPDSALGACLRGLYGQRFGRRLPSPAAAPASPDARLCWTRVRLSGSVASDSAERVRMAFSLFDRFPESPRFLRQLVDVCLAGRRTAELERVLLEERGISRSAISRLEVDHGYVALLHNQGRHAAAAEEERRMESVVAGEVRGMRLLHYSRVEELHVALLRAQAGDSLLQRHARYADDLGRRRQVELVAGADLGTRLHFGIAQAGGLLNDGALEKSVAAFTTLARLADRPEHRAARAQAVVLRGRALVKLGRTREAERDLILGRDEARRAGHLVWEYEAEHNLLHLYEAQGKAANTLAAGEAFARLTALAGARAVQMMANRDLAWFHMRRGEREEARRRFEAMLAAMDSLGPEMLYYAGEYFELIGDLGRAEAAFLRSSGLTDIRPLGGLVRLAEATGDMERALRYARSHDDVVERGGYPEATPLLPALLARVGRVHEALAATAAAREAWHRRGQVAAAAQLGADRAELLLRRADWAGAAALGDSAAGEAASVASTETRLRATSIAALARIRLGGTERASGRTQMNMAIRDAERGRVPMQLVPLLGRSAEAATALGEKRRALALLTRAADLTDSVAMSLPADVSRAGYRAMQLYLSTHALELAIGADSSQLYAEWSVRRKGRGVLDRGTSAGTVRKRPLTALRSRLAPGRALVDYVVLDTTVAALVLTSDGAVLRRLPVRADSLALRIRRLVERLAPRLGDAVDTLHSSFDAALAEQLFGDLLEPLLPDVGRRTRLTLVADGPLHQLPFDLMVVSPATPRGFPRTTSPGFVADRFTVDLAPSLASVGAQDDAALQKSGVIAVVTGPMDEGGALDVGVAEERKAVGRAFAESIVARLEGSGATERAVRDRAGSLRLLHIAAHARANDAEPASARIDLAPSGADDGQLHAFEIDRLRLPATLVVLSACETGAGRLVGGEGVLSLSRAFLRAGARGTVATLWPVGSPASELMAHFYLRLAAGSSPAAALRDAKLELRRGRWPNPLFWAAFVLVTQTP